MGHSSIRPEVRRRKVAALAAYSRQFSVKNTKKGISEKINHKLYYGDLKDAITNPFTGHKFVPTNPHPIPLGRGNATITGYEWVEPVGMLWEHKRYKQPKRIMKWKNRKYSIVKSYSKSPEMSVGTKFNKIKRNACNNFAWEIPANKPGFIRLFPNYPYTIKPLTKEAYWEKLVEHKLKKWEKKNPKPNQDLFESVEEWEQKRFVAEQRFRDFVVSAYDKLLLTGRFKTNESKFNEEKVAEIKDINGEGHNVNQLDPKKSKLIKKAQKITDETKAKRPNLVATNLRDHKQHKGRIILPKAA